MPAGYYEIRADQGATFELSITWESSDGSVVDLTGCAAHMQVRQTPTSPSVLLDCSTSNYDDDTGNGWIVLGNPEPTDGTINFSVPASVMAAMSPGTYKYDLHVFAAGATPVVTDLLGGGFKLFPGITADVGE